MFDTILDFMEQVKADGFSVKAQIFPRPVGYLMGLDLTSHPFRFHPSYKAIAHLPLEQRAQIMRDPAFRAVILAEAPDRDYPAMLDRLMHRLDIFHALGNPPNYEPGADSTLAARAARRGVTPLEEAYNILLEDNGTGLLLDPVVNYIGHSLEPLKPLLDRADTLVALGDGGAHYGMICDGSYPTSMLTYWTRDCSTGARLSLASAVRSLSRDTALAVGLGDRGLLAPGFKADINVIDYDKLTLHAPHMVRDLPAGGKRLVQDADGYVATIVSGEVTYRDGLHTGALPGRLIRGARA
jgi:N-acyl-D-aspartate/D-glutamate deacylase